MMLQAIQIRLWMLVCLSTIIRGYNDNSKFFGNDFNNEEERHGGRRRRPGYQGTSSPCNFGGAGGFGKPKAEGSGRTFFDLQYYNLEHNYHLNINCGGGGGGGGYPVAPVHPAPVAQVTAIAGDQGGHKPLGGHRPLGGGGHGGGSHKPGRPGGGGLLGGWLFGGGNRPIQGGSFASAGPVQGGTAPFPGQGGSSATASSSAIAGILPSPQQFASGLSDGIQTFVGTLPAIGQSFQSILPNFGDFQLPQFNPGGGSFNRPVNRPIAAPSTSAPSVTVPPLITTTDPDDIIYSDQIKPVHEDHDPITEPYTSSYNKRPPGGNMWYYPDGRPYYPNGGRRYDNTNRNKQQTYRNLGSDRGEDAPQARNFRFPI